MVSVIHGCFPPCLIVIQGSYAGARAAHMKILYPDIVWGAIASSGK